MCSETDVCFHLQLDITQNLGPSWSKQNKTIKIKKNKINSTYPDQHLRNNSWKLLFVSSFNMGNINFEHINVCMHHGPVSIHEIT